MVDFSKLGGKGKPPPKPTATMRLLSRLQKNHEMAIIEFANQHKTFSSMLVEVNYADMEAPYLVLDELFPASGHNLAASGEPFKVLLHDHGVPVFFQSEVLEVLEEDDAYLYKLPMPKKATVLQRRSAFRAMVDKFEKRPLKFSVKDNEYGQCWVKDLSLMGVQFVVPEQDLSEQLHVGDLLDPFLFELQKDDLLQTRVEVRRVYYDKFIETTQVGGLFIGLDKIAQRRILTKVSELERLMLQEKKQRE